MRPVLQSFVRTSGLLDLYQFHSPFKLYSLRWFRNKRRRHSKQLKKLVPPIRIERTTNGLATVLIVKCSALQDATVFDA